MHDRNGVGATAWISGFHQSPPALELCRLAPRLDLLECFLVASSLFEFAPANLQLRTHWVRLSRICQQQGQGWQNARTHHDGNL
jgi:hypothetical protein